MAVLAGGILFTGLHFFDRAEVVGLWRSLLDPDGAGEPLLDSRGTIYDRNFKELAVTLEKVSVYADVRDVDAEQASLALSSILDVEPARLRQRIEQEHFRAWLAKNISQEQEEEVASLGLQGVYLHREQVRFYPERNAAAHVVGFVGKSMGLAGVEYNYNALANRYGSSLLESGATLVEEAEPADQGAGYLVLTLDMKIQNILGKLTAELAAKRPGSRIGALLMECRSGNILAEACSPAYDPNNFRNYSSRELGNILAMPTAVPERLRRLFWDASLIHSHYEADEAEAGSGAAGTPLPWSVYSAKRRLGSQLRLWDHLGLNDPLRVDFVKFEDGADREWRTWSAAKEAGFFDSVPQVATPIHLATALNGLVMGGQLRFPRAIERIAGGDGTAMRLAPALGKNTVAPAAAREIRRMVAAEMEQGPLSSGYLEMDSLAFSSGSAGRDYARNRFYVSFIPQQRPELMLFVFANLPPFSPTPAETKSSFAIAEPAQRMTVSMVAMEKVMSTLSDMMTAEEREEVNFQVQSQGGEQITLASVDGSEYLGHMPDLRGMSLRKSLRQLGPLRLEIEVSGTGVVVDQTPGAGERVSSGASCRLVLKPL